MYLRRLSGTRRMRALAYAVLVAFCLIVSGLVPAKAASGESLLRSGETLRVGQSIVSAQYRLILQGDGNLVLYGNGKALWSSRTPGSGADRLTMQSDGNLVLRKGGKALWATHTPRSGADRLGLQPDGNLVLRDGRRAVWDSGRKGANTLFKNGVLRPGQYLDSGGYRLIMQGDGNLVVYRRGGVPVWHTGTHGFGADRLTMQGDGNLVLRREGKALWATHTPGSKADRLVMQGDGNLVLYDGSRARWSSRGGLVRAAPAPGASPAALRLPFASGVNWYVCQGYNGSISHGPEGPALDLTTYPDRGRDGCWGGQNHAEGKPIFSPANGNLVDLRNGLGGVCITFDGGRSMYFGHLSNRRATGRVGQGEQIGTVAVAGALGNANYAHLHLSARSGSGCGGSYIPFDDAHGARFARAPNMTQNGSTNQWAGTKLVAPES